MMGNSCICDDYDFEDQYLLKQKIFTSKKNYICVECGEQITKGEKYEFYQICYRDENSIITFKTCIPCKNMRDDLFHCGWIFGEVWERLEEHFKSVLPKDETDNFEWLIG